MHETDNARPKTEDELRQLVKDVQTRTYCKSAEHKARLPQDDGREDDETGDFGVSITLAVATRQESLGVRISIRNESDEHLVRSDVALEYSWSRAVHYEESSLKSFLVSEGIPRALTSSAAILVDAARAIGQKVNIPAFDAQQALVDRFLQSFNLDEIEA